MFDPIYEQGIRLRHYNIRSVTVHTAVTDRDRAKVLRDLMPGLSPEEHAHKATFFQTLAQHLDEEHSCVLNKAFLKQFGRVPTVSDYKVTAVWNDELPELAKAELRRCAYGATKARNIARAHAAASRQKHHIKKSRAHS